MFYSVGIFRISMPGGCISRKPETTAPRRQGREDPGYIGILKQMAGSRNKKIVITYRKLETSRNLAVFYVWEDATV